jgi:molybdopterin molybdotransferase
MIPVAKAQEIIRDSVASLPPVLLETPRALGCVTAAAVTSPVDLPAFDNSAMDGYAVVAASTCSAGPTTPTALHIAQTIPAGGRSAGPLGPGEAARILTGAPLPPNADAIVMQETVRLEGDRVLLDRPAELGRHIRRRGEDLRRGEIAVEAGRVIRPAEIGLFVALGVTRVAAIPRPRVAILATGDELVEAGDGSFEGRVPEGRIFNSNTYALAAQVANAGGLPLPLGIARDSLEETRRAIEKGFDADLLLISGGVSVGDRDFVRPALAMLGAETKFWRIRMRPGKPVLFAMRAGRPIMGLPGNPAASMMAFDHFAALAIFRLRGVPHPPLRRIDAILEEDLSGKRGVATFVRVALRREGETILARPAGSQSGGIMSSLVRSDGVIIVPEDAAPPRAGEKVEVHVAYDRFY